MVKVGLDTINNPIFGGDLSTYVIYLYEQFSVDPLPSEICIPSESWKPFISMLYQHNSQHEPNYNLVESIEKREHEYDENKVILALSGGKDSTASLLRLVDEGKDVTAYFCRKANLSYPKEEFASEDIAKMYNVPHVKDELSRSGKTDFVENPVKNMIFLARMVEWALDNRCSVVQLGEYWDTGNDKVNVKYDMSDSIDFILAFEEAVRSHYPNIRFDFMFESEATALSYIITRHEEVLPLIRSCLMPERYFNRQLSMVLDKFPKLKANPVDPTVNTLPNRCMKCWKCCMEWVYLVLWNKIPYDKEFMEQHILPVLIKKMPEIDRAWSETEEFKTANTEQILDHVVELSLLKRYIADNSTILKDIHHRFPELDRNV